MGKGPLVMSPAGGDRRSHRVQLRTALGTALPGGFALVVLAGMAITVASLVRTHVVDIGVFRSIGNDGLSLYLGHGLYHDPSSDGYTGLLYTPGVPLLIALLDHIGVWNGWPVALNVLGTAALGLELAALAWRSAGARDLPTAVGAVGVGGAAVWLVATVSGVLYVGWTDMLAWSLALAGLLAGARAHTGSRAAAVAIIGLTLGFWVKQTMLVAALAWAVWLILLALYGRRSWGRVTVLLGLLLAVNVAIVCVFVAFMGRWELFFNFVLPTHQAILHGPSTFAADMLRVLPVPAGLALAMSAAAWGGRPRLRPRLDGPVGLLVVLIIIGLPAAMYFRSKQGGNVNQYFGVVTALGAIAALAWGASRRGPRQLIVDGIVALGAAAAVAATVVGATRFDVDSLRTHFSVSEPQGLVLLAHRASVFDPDFTDLTPGQVYPDVSNAADLLAAGDQPMGLVRALLARRFQYVVDYASVLGPTVAYDRYASGYGKYEGGYFWKLDRVIAAGYHPAKGLPPDVLERRPGLNRAAPLAACFSPFRLVGQAWRIRQGGGFWCVSGPDVITLGAGPTGSSELVSDQAWRATGVIELSAAQSAVVVIRGLPGGTMRVLRVAGGWRITRRLRARVGVESIASPRLALAVGSEPGLPNVPGAAAPISFVASTDRDVRVDLRALTLHG